MTTEREQFDANLPKYFDKALHHKRSGEYANHSVQNDWAMWQAAWQASRKVALEEAAEVAESFGPNLPKIKGYPK